MGGGASLRLTQSWEALGRRSRPPPTRARSGAPCSSSCWRRLSGRKESYLSRGESCRAANRGGGRSRAGQAPNPSDPFRVGGEGGIISDPDRCAHPGHAPTATSKGPSRSLRTLFKPQILPYRSPLSLGPQAGTPGSDVSVPPGTWLSRSPPGRGRAGPAAASRSPPSARALRSPRNPPMGNQLPVPPRPAAPSLAPRAPQRRNTAQ